MSALVYKLLFLICVWSRTLQANSIQNQRYPTRFDNNQWRFGKRQDFLTKSRVFMWKPSQIPAQLFSNIKKPAVPPTFNRYGIQSPPFMSPIHQSYVFAIPTKINYAAYQQVKDIEEKRKPGNLHHITIINSIVPKPYLPTAPTHSHPTTTFKNYRTNNRQLYNQYLNNFGRQNIEHFNKINAQQLYLQQQQHQPLQIVYPSSTLSLQMDKPTIEYINLKTPNFKINEIETEANEITSPVSQCGRKPKDDAKNSASDVLYYYCNNRITNYKNPTQHQLISIQPATTSTSTTTRSKPTESPPIVTTKSSHTDFNIFTTARPMFLPTPNAPLKKSTFLVPSTVSGNGDNFRMQKENSFGHQQQMVSRYENIEQQQEYTTAAAYDNMKLHSFFTIEDAVTPAPDMQVFNDPYQAYRHARRMQINNQRQTTSTTKIPHTTTTTTTKPKFNSFLDDLDDEDYIIPPAYRNVRKQKINYQQQTSTTTKMPETSTIKSKPELKSFFDDLDEEDYIIPETHQYDYSLFSNPQKSTVYKSELRSEQQFPKQNQIIDYTYKKNGKNEFITAGERLVGGPKIKEIQFGLVESITPTTYALPAATTYKPNGHLNELFLTTHKIPSFTSYSSKPISSTTTFDTVLGNQQAIFEKESNTAFYNQVTTTTTLPITNTTETLKKTFKPPLNLRSSAAFKYPKHRIGQKQYKNVTSTSTTKATSTQKKVPKYQRQYKTKKLKQFKHLYTTTSTSTTSATITAIQSTIESHAKRLPVRLLPTTSSTEEPTTKDAVFSRIFSTTQTLKKKNLRQEASLTTEVTKRNKIKTRTSTASTTKNTDSSIRGSARRGKKRANISRREKETAQITAAKGINKNRRRITSSSTTAEPLITRTTSGLNSTSSFSATPASLRTSSTTTTIKSIMRIVNSKSRRKPHNDIKSPIITSSEVNDDQQAFNGRISLNSATSTISTIPPLPIEIYFKKSHNPKI